MANQLLERFGIHKRPTTQPKSKNEKLPMKQPKSKNEQVRKHRIKMIEKYVVPPKQTVQFYGTIHPTRAGAKKSGIRLLSTHAKTEYISRFYTSLDCRQFRCDQENLVTYLSMDRFTWGKHESKRTGADEANKIWREHMARQQDDMAADKEEKGVEETTKRFLYSLCLAAAKLTYGSSNLPRRQEPLKNEPTKQFPVTTPSKSLLEVLKIYSADVKARGAEQIRSTNGNQLQSSNIPRGQEPLELTSAEQLRT